MNDSIDQLVPPTLPQMNIDGVIDQADLSAGNGVIISIGASAHAIRGDYLTLLWAGVQIAEAYVDTDDPADFFPWINTVPAIAAPDGSYSVSYTRRDQAGNVLLSPVVTAVVQRSATGNFPPPTFPEATGGGITAQEAANGTPMQISYPGMASGDVVGLYWQGYESDLTTPVAGSEYSELRTVTALEAQAQQLSTTIPSQNILPIGNGFAMGWYQVSFASGWIANSELTQVVIMTEQTTSFQLSTTTGAPYWRDPSDSVRPYNVVTVAGTPGTEVEVALSSSNDSWFSTGLKKWTGTLTQSGYISLSVYSMSVGAVEVSAYDVNNVSSYATKNMIFNNYSLGNGDLRGYGASTGAPANGSTVNSLYARASDNADITRITFNVTGSASIVGYGQTAVINLSDSRTASVNVVDSTPELSTFTINALQSSVPSSAIAQIEFITFPL